MLQVCMSTESMYVQLVITIYATCSNQACAGLCAWFLKIPIVCKVSMRVSPKVIDNYSHEMKLFSPNFPVVLIINTMDECGFSDKMSHECLPKVTLYQLFISFNYRTWENFGREKMVNQANCELFAKIFLTDIHRYTENVFGIYTDCSLFAKLFLANSVYLYGLPKIYPTKYFLCAVAVYCC